MLAGPGRQRAGCQADHRRAGRAGELHALVAAHAEYEKKRETLRLGAVSVTVLKPGARRGYLEQEMAKGREVARIKLPTLTMDLEFLKRLSA